MQRMSVHRLFTGDWHVRVRVLYPAYGSRNKFYTSRARNFQTCVYKILSNVHHLKLFLDWISSTANYSTGRSYLVGK
jgi:hypothetical protein